MNYYYSVFGLILQSTIPLAAFRRIEPQTKVDVIIKEGIVRRPDADIPETVYQKYLVYHPTFCYQAVENAGAFIIHKTTTNIEVIIDFQSTNTQQTLLAYLYGTGLSAILQLQGKFAIHASGVLVDGVLCLFCGRSGIGKSTLAASLKSRGYPLFTDDKCVLFKDGETDKWMAYPSLQIMRLWENTTATITTDSFLANPVPVVARVNKHQYQIKISEQVTHLVPLKSIYVLSLNKVSEQPKLEQLEGIRKMNFLQAQVFRRFMVKGFQQELALWHFISQLSNAVPIYSLQRHPDLAITSMGDFVEEAIQQ